MGAVSYTHLDVYKRQARNLDEFHRLHEDDGAISCPRSYLAYCTEHIVVMDYVEMCIRDSTYDGEPVRASQLKAQGAMAALLKDALKPNLVQTLEHLSLIHI